MHETGVKMMDMTNHVFRPSFTANLRQCEVHLSVTLPETRIVLNSIFYRKLDQIRDRYKVLTMFWQLNGSLTLMVTTSAASAEDAENAREKFVKFVESLFFLTLVKN